MPTAVTDEELFLFFFARDDVSTGGWGLLNLHVFLKRTGPIEDFAHGLGESVRTVSLESVTAFDREAVGYSRVISMKDLFRGAPQVITFIGGNPDQVVRDSHYYFMHHHSHCYTGVLHPPEEQARYDGLRRRLFELVSLIG